jgi:hypothetical protein
MPGRHRGESFTGILQWFREKLPTLYQPPILNPAMREEEKGTKLDVTKMTPIFVTGTKLDVFEWYGVGCF